MDPTDSTEIAAAIDHLFTHQLEAKDMGARGRAAVLEKFNWDSEGAKLIALYQEILSS
ncbi:hypothetical protein D3C80_2096960 [compost metagenome]